MASKKKTVGTLPHEIMMETWRKEGRVQRQELSLKAIKLDHRLQAREKHLDLDHVKELHGYVKDGAVFPPITVFRIDGKDYVGNGFHRCEVHRKEGRASIKADVVTGTWQEAVEFATCCNFANAALTPNAADKKKAVFMLMDNGWENRMISEIAGQVGASGSSVRVWRTEWFAREGKPAPRELVSASGSRRASSSQFGPSKVRSISPKGGGFKSRVGGKPVFIQAKSFTEAEAKLAEITNKRTRSLSELRGTGTIISFLSARDIWFDNEITRRVKGLTGGVCCGIAVTYISDDLCSITAEESAGSLVAAIGRSVLIAEHFELSRKVILIHDHIDTHSGLIDLARRLGIEFMTLEQFVEAVKADEGESDEAVAV